MFRPLQVLDEEGEEDDGNEKVANQGSFNVNPFGDNIHMTVFYQGRYKLSDLGVFTARTGFVVMTTSRNDCNISLPTFPCGIV